jgi:hypothetical protein
LGRLLLTGGYSLAGAGGTTTGAAPASVGATTTGGFDVWTTPATGTGTLIFWISILAGVGAGALYISYRYNYNRRFRKKYAIDKWEADQAEKERKKKFSPTGEG